MDACQSDRHEGVAERPHVHRPGIDLPGPARDHETPRGASEGKDPLVPFARLAGPDEEAGGPEVEASNASELHLDGTLDSADALGTLSFLGRFHCQEL